jgi:hypothetical protein
MAFPAREHKFISWYVGNIVGLMTSNLMPWHHAVATKNFREITFGGKPRDLWVCS